MREGLPQTLQLDRELIDRVATAVMRRMSSFPTFEKALGDLVDPPSARSLLEREIPGLRAAPGLPEVSTLLLHPDDYGWKPELTEAPPLRWICYAVAFRVLGYSLSDPEELTLIRAAIFYGAPRAALSLSAARPELARKRSYELLKHRAKAYKYLNDYEGAREEYRVALSQAMREGDRGRIAYFLLLLALLVDHYKQQVGWHEELVGIAHRRLMALLSEESAQPDGDPSTALSLRRWLRIADDVLRRLSPSTHRTGYSPVEEPAELSVGDQQWRTRGHQLQFEFERVLPSLEPRRIEEMLVEFAELEESARPNARAWHARSLDLLEHARLACEHLRAGHDRWAQQIPLLNGFLLGGAEARFAALESSARRYSDGRMVARVVLERARWLPIYRDFLPEGEYVERVGLARQRLEDTIGSLEQTRLWNSNVFLDALGELGNVEASERRWQDAYAAYSRAYSHCQELVEYVERDERALEAWVGGEVPGEVVEVVVLTAEERLGLLQGMRRDYRAMLRRSLNLGEEIRKVQHGGWVEEVTRRFRATAGIHRRLATHELFQIQDAQTRQEVALRGMTEILPAGPAVVDVEGAHMLVSELQPLLGEAVARHRMAMSGLYELDRLLNSWAAHPDFGLGDEEGDLSMRMAEALPQIARALGVEDMVEFVASDNSPPSTTYCWDIVQSLLHELVRNASRVARRKRMARFELRVSLRRESGVLHLVAEDNVGETAQLTAAVEAVRAGGSPKTAHQSRKSMGLETLHAVMRQYGKVSTAWFVEVVNENRKRFVIPVGRVQQATRRGGGSL